MTIKINNVVIVDDSRVLQNLGSSIAVTQGGTGANNVADARTNLGAVATGVVTGSGLTMTSAKVLGRTTAANGAIEEMTVGTGLSLAGGVLSSTSVATGPVTTSGLTMTTAKVLGRTTAANGAIEEMAIGSGLSLSGGVLSSTAGGGTVTSVSGSGGSTGLTLTGGPISSTGTLTVGGTLALASGGTGSTSASGARTNLGLGSAAVMTGPGSTIVGISDTQTLSNKTITNNLTINNAALNGLTFTSTNSRLIFQQSGVAADRNYLQYGNETFVWYANGALSFSLSGGSSGVSSFCFTPFIGGGFASKAGNAGVPTSNRWNIAWAPPNGQFWVDDSNIGNFSLVSDRRLKYNIQPLSTATDKILALNPVEFNWKTTGIFKDDGISHWGFVADEVQTVIPNAVEGKSDGLTISGGIQPQLLSDRPIIAALVKALQETINRIDSLETRLIALETTP